MAEKLLDRVFRLQEGVLQKHLSEFPDRYNFISDCIDLLFSPGIPEDIWESIDPIKRTIFNYFYGDSISTLISSIRLCLHGCETDALALMRIVLESLTIFEYINREDFFKLAYSELSQRGTRGKNFSDKLSYENAIKKLGVSDRRERLRGQMSAIGAHSTPGRLGLSHYKINEKDHVKIGVSISNQKTNLVLGEIAALSLFAVRVADEFFEKSDCKNLLFHTKRIYFDEEYKKIDKT